MVNEGRHKITSSEGKRVVDQLKRTHTFLRQTDNKTSHAHWQSDQLHSVQVLHYHQRRQCHAYTS